MITVTVCYTCGGCHKAKGVDVGIINRDFESFTGRGYGFGQWRTPTIDFEAHAPEGWIAFDPFTQATYCPGCWESIVNDIGTGLQSSKPSIER